MFLWRDWWVCLAVYIACELYPRGDSRGYHSTKIPWVWRIWMVKYGNVKDTTSLHPLRKQKIVQDQVSAMPLTTSWRVLRGSGLDVEWDWIITHLRSVYGACSSWRGHRKALIKHYMWQTLYTFITLYVHTLYITPYSNTHRSVQKSRSDCGRMKLKDGDASRFSFKQWLLKTCLFWDLRVVDLAWFSLYGCTCVFIFICIFI